MTATETYYSRATTVTDDELDEFTEELWLSLGFSPWERELTDEDLDYLSVEAVKLG